jgi:hypothetical protein
MAGDAKRNGGRFGVGKWFTSSTPAPLDSTTPSPPPGATSSLHAPNPASYSAANNPYITHPPGASFRSGDVTYVPSNSLHGPPGHSFHQVADPTATQPPYPPQEFSGEYFFADLHLK